MFHISCFFRENSAVHFLTHQEGCFASSKLRKQRSHWVRNEWVRKVNGEVLYSWSNSTRHRLSSQMKTSDQWVKNSEESTTWRKCDFMSQLHIGVKLALEKFWHESRRHLVSFSGAASSCCLTPTHTHPTLFVAIFVYLSACVSCVIDYRMSSTNKQDSSCSKSKQASKRVRRKCPESRVKTECPGLTELPVQAHVLLGYKYIMLHLKSVECKHLTLKASLTSIFSSF